MKATCEQQTVSSPIGESKQPIPLLLRFLEKIPRIEAASSSDDPTYMGQTQVPGGPDRMDYETD